MTHPAVRFLASSMLPVIFTGLMGTARAQTSVEEIATPAPPGSLTPSLVAGGESLYLSWLQPIDEGHELSFARWDGSDWSPKKTIHRSDRFFANWADFASMTVLADGRLAVDWLERAGEGVYEYDVLVAISDDGGESFGAPERPHRDGTLSEHGFVSLVPHREHGFALAWLDGRDFVKDGGGSNEMALLFTTHDGERFGPERILDPRVCECCQTSLAVTKSGFFVAYRDRSSEEIRDIGVTRFDGVAWSEPGTLHRDGWEISGCPVNGPQVASQDERLAVAWFTGEGDEPRVQLALSSDEGRTFAPPVRLDAGAPLGRVDVELVEGSLYVTWLERVEDGNAELMLAGLDDGGKLVLKESVALTSAARSSGFPRMAAFQGELFLAWTEASRKEVPLQVRLSRLRFSAKDPSASTAGTGVLASRLR